MPTKSERSKTGPQLEALLEQLVDPFDPSEIKWRVMQTNDDNTCGKVFAFADPRAYLDRLNGIFTPRGWTHTYDVSEIASLTRMKEGRTIRTGKILVTCVLSIGDLGSHTGTGEEWADEANALTTADAQALKRASSCFGLGRYRYSSRPAWVPLNEDGLPTDYPKLPTWALPRALGGGGKVPPGRPIAAQRGPIDPQMTVKIEGFRRILGDGIYREILWRGADTNRADGIPNAQLQQSVADTMERALRGIRRVGSLAEEMGESTFIAVLDRLQISSIPAIPRLETLKALVAELERETLRPAA
jgi:hypothetical protein